MPSTEWRKKIKIIIIIKKNLLDHNYIKVLVVGDPHALRVSPVSCEDPGLHGQTHALNAVFFFSSHLGAVAAHQVTRERMRPVVRNWVVVAWENWKRLWQGSARGRLMAGMSRSHTRAMWVERPGSKIRSSASNR
jgi:hypothetical protein